VVWGLELVLGPLSNAFLGGFLGFMPPACGAVFILLVWVGRGRFFVHRSWGGCWGRGGFDEGGLRLFQDQGCWCLAWWQDSQEPWVFVVFLHSGDVVEGSVLAFRFLVFWGRGGGVALFLPLCFFGTGVVGAGVVGPV